MLSVSNTSYTRLSGVVYCINIKKTEYFEVEAAACSIADTRTIRSCKLNWPAKLNCFAGLRTAAWSKLLGMIPRSGISSGSSLPRLTTASADPGTAETPVERGPTYGWARCRTRRRHGPVCQGARCGEQPADWSTGSPPTLPHRGWRSRYVSMPSSSETV